MSPYCILVGSGFWLLEGIVMIVCPLAVVSDANSRQVHTAIIVGVCTHMTSAVCIHYSWLAQFSQWRSAHLWVQDVDLSLGWINVIGVTGNAIGLGWITYVYIHEVDYDNNNAWMWVHMLWYQLLLELLLQIPIVLLTWQEKVVCIQHLLLQKRAANQIQILPMVIPKI